MFSLSVLAQDCMVFFEAQNGRVSAGGRHPLARVALAARLFELRAQRHQPVFIFGLGLIRPQGGG